MKWSRRRAFNLALAALLAAGVSGAQAQALTVVNGVASQEPGPRVGEAAAPYTNFCQEQYLRDQAGKLYCNWGPSFTDACAITAPVTRYIEKGGVVSGPTQAGKCSNGQPVLKIVSN